MVESVPEIDPLAEFTRDHGRARKLVDQNSDICFLATLDPDRGPQVRTLVLRDIGPRRVGVFLSARSPKWEQLARDGRYEVLFYYPTVERQYRMSGTFREMDPELVADSWQLRPDGSKYLDHYYERVAPQSRRVESREVLRAGLEGLKPGLGPADQLVAPDHARGLYLEIDRIDRLDLSDPSRLHDRRLFTYEDGRWEERILVP